jgi:hypothetical protein
MECDHSAGASNNGRIVRAHQAYCEGAVYPAVTVQHRHSGNFLTAHSARRGLEASCQDHTNSSSYRQRIQLPTHHVSDGEYFQCTGRSESSLR